MGSPDAHKVAKRGKSTDRTENDVLVLGNVQSRKTTSEPSPDPHLENVVQELHLELIPEPHSKIIQDPTRNVSETSFGECRNSVKVLATFQHFKNFQFIIQSFLSSKQEAFLSLQEMIEMQGRELKKAEERLSK